VRAAGGGGPLRRKRVQRAEMDPAGIRSYNMVPGGEIFDPQSPHYDDWAEEWPAGTPIFWPLTNDAAGQQAGGQVIFEPAE